MGSSCGICWNALQQAEGGNVAYTPTYPNAGGIANITICPGQGTVMQTVPGAPACLSANQIPATSTVGTGSSSGVAGLDWGGLINEIGSAVSNTAKAIQGQQVQRLPNGQYLLPNGQLVGSTPIFSQGSGNMMLLIGVGVVVLLIFMSMSKK